MALSCSTAPQLGDESDLIGGAARKLEKIQNGKFSFWTSLRSLYFSYDLSLKHSRAVSVGGPSNRRHEAEIKPLGSMMARLGDSITASAQIGLSVHTHTPDRKLRREASHGQMLEQVG